MYHMHFDVKVDEITHCCLLRQQRISCTVLFTVKLSDMNERIRVFSKVSTVNTVITVILQITSGTTENDW